MRENPLLQSWPSFVVRFLVASMAVLTIAGSMTLGVALLLTNLSYDAVWVEYLVKVIGGLFIMSPIVLMLSSWKDSKKPDTGRINLSHVTEQRLIKQCRKVHFAVGFLLSTDLIAFGYFVHQNTHVGMIATMLICVGLVLVTWKQHISYREAGVFG